MNQKVKKWLTFSLRWGVAAAGIWYVLAKTPFHDRLLMLDRNDRLVSARVLNEPSEDAIVFQIIDPDTGKAISIARDDVWTQPDKSNIHLHVNGVDEKVKLLAIRPSPQSYREIDAAPAELLIVSPSAGKPMRVPPAKYKVRVPYPLIDIGVVRLVEHARLFYLLGALAVLPLSYFITSRRWHMLLAALDIHISQYRTFVLNMVGSFYNSFMPGSTGGDLIKAWYAAKFTTHKIRAVLSVIVDRLLGVLALIILGGAMCLTQWQVPDCQRVGLVCGAILFCTVVGLIVFYHPGWRKAMGLDWLLKRMPMQRHVHHAVEAMELYGKRPKVSLAALVMTFPVHMTTIISGTLAGLAFGIKMPLIYYWTVIPVITLVAAIPISPQGAGVMEAFAVLLTKNHGVTVSQGIALAMAIRFGQMIWNLIAGIFVLRGGYHAPSITEQEDLETDEDEPPAANSVANTSQRQEVPIP